MKIYFAASLQDSTIKKIEFYNKIIRCLSCYGKVLTEKIGDKDFQSKRKKMDMPNEKIHDFDLSLLLESDVVIVEITTPSLGVGYEIGRATENKKPILCLYNENTIKLMNISKIIQGTPITRIYGYKSLGDIKLIVKNFFKGYVDKSQK